MSWGTYFSMEGDHFLLPILVREGDHNLLGGTVFGSQFWSGGLILAATFGPGGPLLGGTGFRVTGLALRDQKNYSICCCF